jgi:DNA-directed RNA polymerase specialized sigma24 family protein|tara:strand:- start:6083 stop:6466 length:384 start_codon:yes stop_codon:yes gene_type:complete
MPKRLLLKDPQEATWLFDLAAKGNPVPKASEMEAMMEALPYMEPSMSPTNAGKEWIALVCESVMFHLDADEREIVEVLAYEKLSLRKAGEKLNIPKTTLARRRDEIWKKIKKQLLEYPEIREYIYGH